MSSRDWKFRIQDILNAIVKIGRYIEDTTVTEFKQDELETVA